MKILENCSSDGAKVIMDKAYEGNEIRQVMLDLGMEPVAPSKSNRLRIWEYDIEATKN